MNLERMNNTGMAIYFLLLPYIWAGVLNVHDLGSNLRPIHKEMVWE